ncbi:spoIIIJ-associated protein [Atopostipes suicloacalis DSM 15692]|uniref:RNA-binding protein KhpB n=1 Tax=Atopostipes suicloacalis DSM 15692 TaxID=1121025 RepID=A0A1M4X5R1_9LACT|nr:RNA-binding cell elongation regulator Jag/EloR [Atopostipes suicloacalis]SHE88820.1 spoIIIJ-associated protein [Atopostipes suicloacalis DSM 15692]
MKEKYIAQAATQEEAIIKGLNALSITRDEAKITVEEPGKKGFLGIGQKDAVVIVERREKINLVDELFNDEFEIEREQPSTLKEAKKEEKKEKVTQTAKKQEVKNEKEAKAEEAKMSVEELAEGRDPAEVELVEKNQEAAQTESKVDKEEQIQRDDQEAIDNVRQYLKDIIVQMNISDVEVYTSRVKDNVKYDVETENAGLVIGRHGKVLNGLQTLAQNHMHQLAHSKINVRVDVEKYRERRRNTVEALAERTAEKVIKTNRRVKLDPMPAHERKQIHHYLNENPKVKTHSEGREPKRYLVVEPENQ